MSRNLSLEELVIDDSFNEYCFQRTEADIFYWEEYIRAHPGEKEKIEEAKQLVLGLAAMLKEDNRLKTIEEQTSRAKIITLFTNKTAGTGKKYIAVAAATVVLLLVGIKFYLPSSSPKTPASSVAVNKKATAIPGMFITDKGERKMVILPDSTKLYLNAGSCLTLDKDFGKLNRTVYLTGEALFDVVHNKQLPFIVHMNKYDVKVLGTLFNIRAYPGDKQSETSLIRGKVEIQISNSAQKIILSPDQKAVISNESAGEAESKEKMAKEESRVIMRPLTHNEKDNSVIETAWSLNRLEIVDESLADIKDKLERWYNVKINIRDSEVNSYTFSATFEKETIQQVMDALKEAYYFNYEMKDDEITISK